MRVIYFVYARFIFTMLEPKSVKISSLEAGTSLGHNSLFYATKTI